MSSPELSNASLFRNKFVQVILASAILLQVGIWVRNFSVLLFVSEKTNNDPTAVSLIYVAEYAPIFLFSLIGGAFADRWRPKLTMIWCDLLSALSIFVVLPTLFFGSWKAVFFATLISAILSQFSQPSAMKLFKHFVPSEQFQGVMAMFQSIMALFMILGPMLGTFVYQSFGINMAIAVMGVSFLLSAVVLVFLPADISEVQEKQQASIWKEVTDGLRYVWNSNVLRAMIWAFSMAGLAIGLLQTLMIFIIVERLHLPKENLQWFLATFGAAMLIGGGLVMSLSKKISPQKLLAMGMLVNAFTAVGIGFSTNFYLTLLFQFLNGLFMPAIQIGVNTLILKVTEESFVGRVNGVLSPMFIGMMVVSMSLAGVLKTQFSLVPVYASAGVLFFIGMLTVVPIFGVSIEEKKEAQAGAIPTQDVPGQA